MAGDSVRAWNEAAQGEAVTASVLAGLPASWTVLHRLTWRGRQYDNVDHVVVGPPGIFVIDSRVWSGRVAVSHGVLRQDGHDRISSIRAVVAAAAALSQTSAAARFDHVHGVLCLVGNDVPAAWVGGVLVCSAHELVDELLSYAEVLPGGVAVVVAAEIQRQLDAVSGPSTVTTPRVFGGRSGTPRPHVARGALRVGRTVQLAVGAALVIGVATNPHVVASVSSDVKDFVVEAVNPNGSDPDDLRPPPKNRKQRQRETQG